MAFSPEETRLIEVLTRDGKMTELEARDYLAGQRREASRMTRSDARLAVFGCILGLLVCAALFYYQYHIGRFLLGLLGLLIAVTAFCPGALARHIRNLNACLLAQ